MALKTDPADVDTTIKPSGQQRDYLVLSDEEIAKGFVRPLRQRYRHVGPPAPVYPLRDLTADEAERYAAYAYVKCEEYPPEMHPLVSRYWRQQDLKRVTIGGCGTVTSMGIRLAETYARQPNFYGGTFCVQCGTHFPVGAHGEFVWVGDDESDGDRVGT